MPSGTSVLAIETGQLPDSNTVIVPIGSNGKISVWNAHGNTEFNLDLHGYFVPTDGTAGFHPLTSERIVDSVAGMGVSGPTISAGTNYDVQVTGDSIPTGTTAIFANVKVTSATAEGGLRVGKGGESLSGLPSALNFDSGVTTDSGLAIPLSSSGKLRFYSTASGGTAKIYIDVQGYFAPGDGAEFHVGSQQVLVDNLTVPANTASTVTAVGHAGLPSEGGLGSVVLTVFASNWTASGGVSVADAEEGVSDLSNASFTTSMDSGVGVNSTAIVPVSEPGELVIQNKSNGSVKVRLTVQGWFAALDDPIPAAKADEMDDSVVIDPSTIDLTEPEVLDPVADAGPVTDVQEVKDALPDLLVADATVGQLPDAPIPDRVDAVEDAVESDAIEEGLEDVWVASKVDQHTEEWTEGLETFAPDPGYLPYDDNSFTVTTWEGVQVDGDQATAILRGHNSFHDDEGWTSEEDGQFNVTLHRESDGPSAYDGWQLVNVAIVAPQDIEEDE